MNNETNSKKIWNPSQYLKFAGPRLKPALDLLYSIKLDAPQESPQIYDLGCGAGNVTQMIAEQWPNAQVIGIDSSPEMIKKASQEQEGQIVWQEGGIGTWTASKPADLIYSNAALQWLSDHETLFPRLLDQLAPGGVFAVQMPMSWAIPSHHLMREALNEIGPGNEQLRQDMARPTALQPKDYYEILASRTKNLEIWTTEYFQILEGDDAVLEWVKGTGLRPILNGLTESDREIFLNRYRQKLAKAYPQEKNGKTFYPFPRLFIVARV